MKWIKYKREIPASIEKGPDGEEIIIRESYLQEGAIACNDSDIEIQIAEVMKVAYNGEYIIEDDGEPEPSAEPTQLDRIEAQTTYTAMMTDTLLEV